MLNLRPALLSALSLLIVVGFGFTAESIAQKKDREQMLVEMKSLHEQLKSLETGILAPAPEDLAAFADFLRKPDTGVVRLMPREKYDHKLVVRGGGAYYSFVKRTHEYGYGSDISLEQAMLQVGFAGADFGFLTMLGDVPIDGVTTETPGVQYLAFYSPPETEPEARIEQRRTGGGFEFGGFTYWSRLPLKVNKTYAVRSVSYSSSDVLVAFRVTRQDSDGSIILAWKKLREFDRPTLARVPAQ
jgi:hypothetical protein